MEMNAKPEGKGTKCGAVGAPLLYSKTKSVTHNLYLGNKSRGDVEI